jgi:excisionase family DNA binding protein
MSTERLLLRVSEAAELIGVSRSMAYVMVARGELPVVRIGKAIRIPMAGLRRWIEAGEVGGPSA